MGVEPDPRVVFANERTFLAWIRTALALVASGVGVIALVPDPGIPLLRELLAVLLTLLGATVAGASYRRWRRNDEALRHGDERVMRGHILGVLAVGVVLVGVLAAALLVAAAILQGV